MHTLSDKIRFIEKCFGRYELGRGALNAAVKCPNCGYGDKKKFIIRTADDACHCWVCGVKGKNLAPIIKKYFSPSLLEEYIRIFGEDKLISADLDKIERKLMLPSGFKLLVHSLDTHDPDIKTAITYIKSRGLTEDDMWFFKFGTSVDNSMHRRVIMPSFDIDGRLNYYIARSIDVKTKPKYLNASVNKQNIIFNEMNIDWKKPLTIVEGPFDLTKSDLNTSCVLGSGLSDSSFLFARIMQNNTPIILALDSDMQDKQQRIAKKLDEYGIDVKILSLSSKHDVGEMTKKEFLHAKENATSWNRDAGLLYKISKISSSSFVRI